MTAEVLAVISDLAGDGLTMIVVTHAMQFARRVAHTVHVFDEGQGDRIWSAGRRSLTNPGTSPRAGCSRPCRQHEPCRSGFSLTLGLKA